MGSSVRLASFGFSRVSIEAKEKHIAKIVFTATHAGCDERSYVFAAK